MKIFKSKTFLRHAKSYVNQLEIANTTFQCVGCFIFILLPNIFQITINFFGEAAKKIRLLAMFYPISGQCSHFILP